MHRWCSLVLVLVVVLMCGTMGGGQPFDPNDSFDDNWLAPDSWEVFGNNGASAVESNGVLTEQLPAGTYSEAGIKSHWKLRGPFDVQVDYALPQWPSGGHTWAGLAGDLPGDSCYVKRMSDFGYDPGGQVYLAHFQAGQGNPEAGITPSADAAGTFRLVRDADSVMTAYYRSAGSADWVAIYTAPVSADDMGIMLACWGSGTGATTVTFDNLQVNRGALIPAPYPDDNFDDGVIDTSRWILDGDPKSAFQETDGHLVMSMMPTDFFALDLTATWWLHGPFDIQVDYSLLDWPAHSGALVGLLVMSPDDHDWEWVQRVSGRVEADGTDEVYLANVRCPEGCFCEGVTPTLDTTGTLRLTRDENSLFTAYYWSAADGQWVILYQRTIPDTNVRPRLTLWGPVTAPVTVAFDNFRVNRGELVDNRPQVQDIEVTRGKDVDAWGWTSYHQALALTMYYPDLDRIGCIRITDPLGDTTFFNACTGDNWLSDYDYEHIGESPYRMDTWLRQDDDHTFTCGYYQTELFGPPPTGVFTIETYHWGSLLSTITTSIAPPASEALPALAAPGPDAVIDSTAPTFEWASLPGPDSWLQVREEGNASFAGPWADDGGEIWRTSLADIADTHVAYDFDGSAAKPALGPGRACFWQINSQQPSCDSGPDTSPRIRFWDSQSAFGRFTVYGEHPPVPALPGKLAYNGLMWGDWSWDFDADGLQLYTTDQRDQTWLAPDSAGKPNWSWDGTKLLYYRNDLGLWIDSAFDRSRPYHIPIDIWGENSWSPDSTRVAFGWVPWGAPHYQLWMASNDGSDLHLVAESEAGDIVRTDWSPDGLYLEQSRCCDPSGNNIWLTRFDGSESHPMVPTDVIGWPGYRVTWMNQAVWSPDGRRLAVDFTANADDGSYINGIGTVSRDGGPLTVSFLTPPEIVCCAQPDVRAWSPDGTKLVMSSGHHLAPDPEWANGKFEHGKELWLISADGAGEPVRLTYNYSFDYDVGWWAPNTLVGKGVPIVRGDATLTFAQVAAEGSTRLNVTGDVPGPAPAGYTFVSDLWSGATTAGYQGDITIALKYDASLAGQEDALAVMEWNPDKAKWQNITAHPIDAVNHIIRGQTKGLRIFAICVRAS